MPDFWIKKMAINHKMIDPFVEKLVKNEKKYHTVWYVQAV